MRVSRPALPAALVLLLSKTSHGDDADDPISGLRQISAQVVHWEGTFGTYLVPNVGNTVRLDLDCVGKPGLLELQAEAGPGGAFPLADLKVVKDTTEGDREHGWVRRILLKRAPESGQRSGRRAILEILVQHEVERFEEQDGRRIRLSGNITHTTLRIHTLEADDTISEYGVARSSVPRDD